MRNSLQNLGFISTKKNKKMAKVKLQKNDLFVLVEHGKKDYFQFHGLPISDEFEHHPSGDKFRQTPDTYQCEVDLDIEVNHNEYLADVTFGGNLPQLVGPRPRNIVKR
jgi:hypothetical protein